MRRETSPSPVIPLLTTCCPSLHLYTFLNLSHLPPLLCLSPPPHLPSYSSQSSLHLHSTLQSTLLFFLPLPPPSIPPFPIYTSHHHHNSSSTSPSTFTSYITSTLYFTLTHTMHLYTFSSPSLSSLSSPQFQHHNPFLVIHLKLTVHTHKKNIYIHLKFRQYNLGTEEKRACWYYLVGFVLPTQPWISFCSPGLPSSQAALKVLLTLREKQSPGVL